MALQAFTRWILAITHVKRKRRSLSLVTMNDNERMNDEIVGRAPSFAFRWFARTVE